jgi:FkbM family methyltransferase
MARRLGFTFVGTNYTELPNRIWLFNQPVALDYPDDRTLIGDVINIFLDDEYGLASVRVPVRTVVDIGANIGLFSLWARHNFSSATIHGYEPNEHAVNYAAANLRGANVTLFGEGVSGENAKCRLVVDGTSRGAKTEKTPLGRINLTGIGTVIERIGGKLDLLKIDCEGGEWDIFHNTHVFQHVRQIRMEYHLGENHDLFELNEVIESLGFRTTKLISHGDFGIAWLENIRAIGWPVTSSS